MDGNTIASFTYRGDGMRKTMITGSKTITFHYDEDKNVTNETDGNNQVIASYTFADNELDSEWKNVLLMIRMDCLRR